MSVAAFFASASAWRSRPRKGRGGFTLIELLLVVSLVALLAGLAAGAFRSLRNSGLTNASTTLASLLEQARSYAMGQNTYVYFGIEEVDAVQTLTPSRAAEPGVGRIAVALVASRDGTRGYDDATGAPAWTGYGSGEGFLPLAPVRVLEGVHLADLPPSSAGGMVRSAVDADARLANAEAASATPFAWPLGRGLGGGQYNFTKVIQFDPQGTARIVLAGHGDALPQALEIGLLPCRGNVAPAAGPTGDRVAIQVDGVSGAVRVYRP